MLNMANKRIIILLFLFNFFISFAYAQPKSLNYEDEPKTDDFFLDVLDNPSANLYKFLLVGLNSHNTELKDLNIYLKDTWTKQRCLELNISVEEAYKKVKACWNVFLEVENTNLESFGQYVMDCHPNNIYLRNIQQNCPNKKLQHKLRLVPLKLEKY